ncbi:MAG: phosphoribosylglycinamide formyltransferase [Oscillospiraceae bacterium]|jgi:phosphoribosylglycinamide formyltransferase-1|nr:phosphoribosylglycinamide formyltransferase [Oscillospiraceae bacterium]
MAEPTTKKRIAVFVSGGGTNLQCLIDAQADGTLRSGEIALVISSKPGVYALERAARAGLPTLTFPRKGMTLPEFEANISAALEAAGIDILVTAGFLTIFSADFVSRWPRRILNIHPALLPAFGGKGYYGLRLHRAVLERGVKVTGATVHFVNEICDGGEILLQKAVDVLPGDTPETLQRRVMEQAEWILLPRAVELVCADLAADPKPPVIEG